MNAIADALSSPWLLLAEAASHGEKIQFGRTIEIVATVLFALAVIHTFCVKIFAPKVPP